ncbi:Flap endonuclease 1-like [Oopsacas minuta]|uniref:Flap endonuclease 1 n=1 Tax=Oopsacas minuta TaxID=111878 RepID=A0AAV7KIF3_9METZ|nr:Flap endonuclease 1-like [Oopsacas minuta]
MGIHKLMTLIADYAPSAIKENEIKNYFGRKIAIDASMSIYQFIIAIRTDGDVLMNEHGEVTSHLQGLLYRTARMLENGLKPLYVFDGKPPLMKSGELAKRKERRQKAEAELTEASEVGDKELAERMAKRTVKVTSQHSDECKRLLTLMGVPHIVAPCEAEAQCAELAKSGKVFAVASEDMDSLTFGSSILLRNMMMSEAKKMPIREIHLNTVLETLNLSHNEFVDLCILMGCDYTDTIKGIGYKKALNYIQEHKKIEDIVRSLDPKKYTPPEDWSYPEARELFLSPEVTPGIDVDFKWGDADEEGMVSFLVGEKSFNEDRVRNVYKRIEKSKGQGSQARMDSFFKTIATPESSKRKVDPSGVMGSSKKSKIASASGRGRGKKR